MIPHPVTAAAAGTITIGGDLQVRRLGYGAMRLTGQGVWGPPHDHDNALTVLRRVVALGVTFIDTADSYGPAVNEELIAEALYPYPSDLIIATKGGYTRSGPNQWHPSAHPAHLRRVLEESLRRLRREHIDLYQLHTPDPTVPFAESVGALVECQSRGLIRHIGLSNVSLAGLREAQQIARIVSVQNMYNLTERHSEDVLATCTAEGLAFLPWYPLATGDLARQDGPLQQIAERHRATPAQVAIAWLLQRSPVVLPIPGTAVVRPKVRVSCQQGDVCTRCLAHPTLWMSTSVRSAWVRITTLSADASHRRMSFGKRACSGWRIIYAVRGGVNGGGA